MGSALYLASNVTNLFLKPLVSPTTGDANQEFISQVGEDISKVTAMAIMYEVNRIVNNDTEGFEEADCIEKIETTGTDVIYELVCGDIGSSVKILRTFVPPKIETIADPVIAKLVSKLQLHLTHSAEVIVRSQASIYLLNSKMVDVT